MKFYLSFCILHYRLIVKVQLGPLEGFERRRPAEQGYRIKSSRIEMISHYKYIFPRDGCIHLG